MISDTRQRIYSSPNSWIFEVGSTPEKITYFIAVIPNLLFFYHLVLIQPKTETTTYLIFSKLNLYLNLYFIRSIQNKIVQLYQKCNEIWSAQIDDSIINVYDTVLKITELRNRWVGIKLKMWKSVEYSQ